MENLHTIQEIETFIATNQLVFVYVSQKNCSVCQALLPKVQQLLEKYPEVHLAEVKADEVKDIAAVYTILSAPTLVLFVEGKEYFREGRFVQFQRLNSKIQEIYHWLLTEQSSK